jgi:hypothetical protein
MGVHQMRMDNGGDGHNTTQQHASTGWMVGGIEGAAEEAAGGRR